jgi:hypothetical protein
VADAGKRRRAHGSLLVPRAGAAVFFYSRDGLGTKTSGCPDGSISEKTNFELYLLHHIGTYSVVNKIL